MLDQLSLWARTFLRSQYSKPWVLVNWKHTQTFFFFLMLLRALFKKFHFQMAHFPSTAPINYKMLLLNTGLSLAWKLALCLRHYSRLAKLMFNRLFWEAWWFQTLIITHSPPQTGLSLSAPGWGDSDHLRAGNQQPKTRRENPHLLLARLTRERETERDRERDSWFW